MVEYLSFIFIIIAATCNALMDVISFHFESSVFSKCNAQFWDPSISWKNKYVDGDPAKGEKHIFWDIPYPVQITDAWHLFKTLMIISISLAIVTYHPTRLTFIENLIAVGICWNITFSTFYNYVFINNK